MNASRGSSDDSFPGTGWLSHLSLTRRANSMTKYLVTALVFCATPCLADVRLPRIIGSNMVLQRDSEVKIWGWADAGEEIRVTGDWLDTKARVTADAEGNWQVRLKTGAAGGPHAMTIAGKNSIRLEQILFGEVWIASGQSNMEMPLIKVSDAYTGIKDAGKEVAQANYPEIRLFQVGNFSSKEPLDDVQSGICHVWHSTGSVRVASLHAGDDSDVRLDRLLLCSRVAQGT